jgi:molybdate-binding protein/transcriptional regulator with XRE-family HTH domain
MSSTPKHTSSVQKRRTARGWSQQDLADRAGLSRAGVSAIESGRLSPSVAAALALAQVLDCSVEELFGQRHMATPGLDWALGPPTGPRRYWKARIGSQVLAYAVEDDASQLAWHDGVATDAQIVERGHDQADRTLVLASCDPAAGLLVGEYARQFGMRLIVLRRSSREALELVAAGKVHAAGVHLGSSARRSDNVSVARAVVGQCTLVHVARWEEGLALSPRLKGATIGELARQAARWVGREPGSGARQCQDAVLGDRPPPRRVAHDHRGVATAVRCGWADVGPCLRLTSEESGLRFLKVARKEYDICFPTQLEGDPRLTALVATLRSRDYRSRLADLPGYAARHTGELV